MQDLTGHSLGQYRIVEPVGRGGMATVFKAFQPSLERYVAIKVLPPYYAHEPGFAERFVREAKAVARLEHPHILPVYDFGQEGDYTYIVMKYVPSGTLKDLISAGQVSFEQTTEIVAQIAKALDYAHEQGIIHRDVKPSNVLMDRGQWALLMDFGLARMVEGSTQLTASGVGVGTPAYMPPEQGQGKRVDHRADVYSLGVILYEMLTGRVPFDAETPMAVVIKHITDPLPLPRLVNPNIPEPIELVVLKALAKDPADRHQSAGELANALRRALSVAETLPSVELAEELAPLPDAPAAPAQAASIVEEALPVRGEPSLERLSPVAAEPAAPASLAIPVETEAVSVAMAKEAVIAMPRRKMPWWAFAIGAVVMLGIVGGIIMAASGILRPSQSTSTPTSAVSSATNTPTVRMLATPTVALSNEQKVSPGDWPGENRVARPCDWDGLGNGLCIFDSGKSEPSRILQDLQAQIEGASWSPDGRQIAFSAIGFDDNPDTGHTLYIVNADGSGLIELPRMGNSISPAWSPDGQWLAFHNNCDLALMRVDGTEQTVLWPHQDRCVASPQWSLDSDRIVFSAMPGEDWGFPLVREVLVFARDGGKTIVVVSITHQNDENLDTVVAFSPDGTHVAYIDAGGQPSMKKADGSGEAVPLTEFPYWWHAHVFPQWGTERPASPGPAAKWLGQCEGKDPPQICIEDAQTGQQVQIRAELKMASIDQPVWSPDGRQVVFSAGSRDKPDHKLYIVNEDGSGLQQITRGENNDLNPVWSPSGYWIAFHRNCGLWIVSPNGNDARVLLSPEDRFCISWPVWSPDNQWIAFVNRMGGTIPTIWMIDRDGQHLHQVYLFGQIVDPYAIAWSPDGRQIVCWYNDRDTTTMVLINADGSGQPQVIENEKDMPWAWRSNYWPQWNLPWPRPGISGGSATPGGKVKVALILPLTGPVPELGQASQEGAELSILGWNEQGGLLGGQIEWVVADGGCQAKMATAAAQRVIDQDRARFIIGELCSSASLPVADVANSKQVLQISPMSTHLQLTQGRPFTFRICFHDSFQANALATFARQELKASTAAVLFDKDNSYSQSLAEFWSSSFQKQDGKVVLLEPYTAQGTDFAALLSRVADADPAVLFLPDMDPNVNMIARQAKEQGITAILMGGDGWESDALDLNAVDGGYFSTHFDPSDSRPVVQDFVSRYRLKYGKRPISAAALAYDATCILLKAIKQAGTADVGQVRDVLAQIDFEGVTGQIAFDPEHNPIKGVAIVHITGGKKEFIRFVKP